MKLAQDSDKTKAQLIAELQALRLEVARLRQEQALIALMETVAPGPSAAHEPIVTGSTAVRRSSEERLRLALESAELGFWEYDLLSDRLEWSDRSKAILGLPPTAEVSYALFLSRLHPQDRDRVEQMVQQAIADRSDCTLECRAVWADGSLHWVAVNGRALYDEAGRAVLMAGVMQDISDRKQAEASLIEFNQQVTGVLESITDAFFALDHNWRFIYLNPQAEQVLQRSHAELVGKCVWEEFPDADNSVFYREYQRAVRQGVSVAFEEFYLPLNAWFDVRAYPCRDGLSVYFRNVNARKQAEADLRRAKLELEIRVAERTTELSQTNIRLLQELVERQQVEAALRQSEAKFRSLCECSPVGIFMMDAGGNCIYINPRGQEICGCTFIELLKQGWLCCLHPDDQELAMARRSQAIAQQQGHTSKDRYVHKDGSIRYGQVHTAPIFAVDGELIGYVGTIEDITERQAIEKMKSEFVSVVSHELRTPLSSIRGSLGLLASGVLHNKPETIQQMLEIAAIETERLVRLVNDILDLERLESNKVALNWQWCNAEALMRRSIETMQSLADENQIQLFWKPLKAQIWVDGDRIIQTLVNLLSNAIKFSPAGSPVCLSAEVTHESGGSKDAGSTFGAACVSTFPTALVPPAAPARILFQIKDQGRGIPADQLERIFERFQQIDASDSRQKGGTGLGLAICRSIVQQHGGTIWVESTIGLGSRFYFALPIPFHTQTEYYANQANSGH